MGQTEREDRRASDEPDDAKDVVEALVDCENQVDHLKRENKLLRDASRTFGALAERLSATLALERRGGYDRRSLPRSSPGDRRQTSNQTEPQHR